MSDTEVRKKFEEWAKSVTADKMLDFTPCSNGCFKEFHYESPETAWAYEAWKTAYAAGSDSQREAPESQPDQLDECQNKVVEWGTECFGAEHMADHKVRALRLLEEAVEFAQSVDAPVEQCAKLVEYVYSRPKGSPSQELGGVGVGLVAAAAALGVSALETLRAEIQRVLSKPRTHFTQRNQNKLDAGFNGEAGAPPAQLTDIAKELASALDDLIGHCPCPEDDNCRLCRRAETSLDAWAKSVEAPRVPPTQLGTCREVGFPHEKDKHQWAHNRDPENGPSVCIGWKAGEGSNFATPDEHDKEMDEALQEREEAKELPPIVKTNFHLVCKRCGATLGGHLGYPCIDDKGTFTQELGKTADPEKDSAITEILRYPGEPK